MACSSSRSSARSTPDALASSRSSCLMLAEVAEQWEKPDDRQTTQAPPLPEDLERLLRRLRLPYVRSAAPEVLATAKAQRWEPAEILRVLLKRRQPGATKRRSRTRRRASGAAGRQDPRCVGGKRTAIPKATQQALRTLEWIGRAENLCVLRTVRDRQEPLRRSARPPRDRPRQTVAWHTLERSPFCCDATEPTTASQKRSEADPRRPDRDR